MRKLLEVADLRVSVVDDRNRRAAILRGISLDVAPGEILGVLGESGAGKSTLLRAVAGLLPEQFFLDGSIRLEGDELLKLSEEALRRKRGREIGMVFQEPLRHLNPSRRVAREIDLLLRFHRRVPKGESLVLRRRELLREVGLPPLKRVEESYPHELSGGMRQRFMIAMALAGDPSLLLADEPTTALDFPLQQEIVALLRRLVRRRGMGVLYVSHDLRAIEGVADRLMVVLDGEAVESGPTGEILAHPEGSYTRRLLASAPGFESRGRSLVHRGRSAE